MTLGSASFVLSADNAQLLQTLAASEAATRKSAHAQAQIIAQASGASVQDVKRAADQMARAETDHARAAEQAAQKIARANQDAAKSFLDTAKGALALGASFVGVQASAEGLKRVLEGVVDATLKQQQAQFAVSKLYGESSPIIIKNANDLAAATGRSKTEALEAAASVATLGRNYALTGDQIQKVLKISADLAAVRGISLGAAAERTQSALRGEAEAIEYLGQALNSNALKAFADMTESQRKHFETLGETTKAQIVFNALIKNTADLQGAAAERAETAAGKIDKLKASMEDASAAMGKSMLPTLGQAADLLSTVAEGATAAADAFGHYGKIGAEIRPSNSLLVDIANAGILQGILNNIIANTATGLGFSVAGGVDPSAAAKAARQEAAEADQQKKNDEARAKQAVDAEKDRQKAIAEVRKRARDLEAQAGEEVAHREHDLRVRDLDDQVDAANAQKETKLRALDAQTKATVASLHEQAQAAKDASDAQIAQLHVDEEAIKRAAADRHDAAVAGIAAEVKAVEDATSENIRNLEIERDHAKQASEDKRDAAIKALDDEKRARDAARVQEDRSLQDGVEAVKRAEDDRHQAATRGFEDETKAANDAKDHRLRLIDEEAKADQANHDRRLARLEAAGKKASNNHEAALRHLSEEGDAAQKLHDEATRRLSAELEAATLIHDATLRGLSNQGENAQAIHEAALRRISTEGEAAQKQHDEILQALSDELDAGQHAHDVRLRELGDEIDKAQDVHDAAVRGIQAEGEQAQRVHEQAVRALDQQRNAEDDRHRSALANIDAETRAQQDAIDAQIRGLDDLDKAQQAASTIQGLQDRVAGARTGVLKAQSSGNQAEIDAANRALLAAEQALRDGQTKIARDALRQQLQDQKAAIADQATAQKAAEDDRNRQIKAGLDAQKQAAADELKRIQAVLAARKQAADDDLDLVKRRVNTEKQAADDELALVKASVEARRQAANEGLAQIQERLQAEKQAADDDYTRIQARLKAEQEAADETLRLIRERVANEKQAADDQFKVAQERLAKEKIAADDLYKLTTDRLAKEKDQADDALTQAKDRLDRRKTAVEDANKHELEAIAGRKRQEQDAHDAAVQLAQDQATNARRAIDDRRAAENQADQDRRREAQAAYDNEQRLLHARYDAEDTGEIPTLRRALAAFQETANARKTAADDLYANEQRQIDDTYNHPQTGLIPLAQKAAEETARKFAAMAASVEASAQLQRQSINDTYNAPDGKSGIIDRLKHLKQDADDALSDALKAWEKHKEDLVGKNGVLTRTFDEAKDQFDRLIKHFEENGGVRINPQGGVGNQPYGPQAPGGAGPGEVPAPYRVTFPFDAPYNGPYAGGAAWPGGPSRHRGVDLALPGPDNGRGTPYGAFQAGKVAALIPESSDPAGGNGILIQTEGGLYNYYGHNDRFLVGQGDHVDAGQKIGTLGRSGLDPGMQTHLHYEVRRGINGDPIGQTIDPVPYMTKGTVGASGNEPNVVTFSIFGHTFTIRVPGGGGGSPPGSFENMVRRIRSAVEAYGIPPEVPAAIAGIESGYEHPSVLAAKYHNWFGVKGSGDAGQTPPFNTQEFLNGEWVTTKEPFAAYSSDAASFADWARRFSRGRYEDAKKTYQQSHHPIDYLQGLFDAGYATDPDWVGKVRHIGGFANGGWIDRPSVISDLSTRQPYAIAGEGGRPEWVAPVSAGGMGDTHIHLEGAQIYDGTRFEDRLVSVLHRADRRGRINLMGLT